MIRSTILCAGLCCLAFLLPAQSYNTTLGMRLGTDWGMTVKQRFAKKATLELITQSSLQREEVVLTLLAEKHMPFLTRRFNLYTGGGFHKGWLNEPVEAEAAPYKDPFGLTFIMGIEMTLARINLSYDFKPAVNLTGGEKQVYFQTGVSIRYVIGKREKLPWEKKRKKKGKNREGEGFNWKFWENW